MVAASIKYPQRGSDVGITKPPKLLKEWAEYLKVPHYRLAHAFNLAGIKKIPNVKIAQSPAGYYAHADVKNWWRSLSEETKLRLQSPNRYKPRTGE